MNLIQEAYARLFPGKELFYQTYLEYNRRLSDFNANIRQYHNTLTVHLNLQWKDIDTEIKIGLIQSLLLKIMQKKAHTSNIELYNNFIKNIPGLTPKTKSDPLLEASFERVNQQFFDHSMEKPNLQWGPAAVRKLAHYNFHDDTITISSVFKTIQPEVLDYLMYHELLHKHFTFQHKNGRSSFHTPEFKAAEHLYPQHKAIEQELNHFLHQERRKERHWFTELAKRYI